MSVSYSTPIQHSSYSEATTPSIALKPPKPPEKPLVPYMRFSKKMWHKIRDMEPNQQLWNIGKRIGLMWRALNEEEKGGYQAEYEREKVEWDKAMKIYHASPEYQKFLAEKAKLKQLEKDAPVRSISATQQTSARSTPQPTPTSGFRAAPAQPTPQSVTENDEYCHKSMRPTNMQPPRRGGAETGVFIQPVDQPDDNGEQGQMSKRIHHHQRFDRNQRLMADLFSDQHVQDCRTVVTQQRIDMLRKQAGSLIEHQKKLEGELDNLEQAFYEKKRKIQEDRDKFESKLQKMIDEAPQETGEKYEQLVEEQTKKLIAAYKIYKERLDVKQNECKETNQDQNETKHNYYDEQSAAKAT